MLSIYFEIIYLLRHLLQQIVPGRMGSGEEHQFAIAQIALLNEPLLVACCGKQQGHLEGLLVEDRR